MHVLPTYASRLECNSNQETNEEDAKEENRRRGSTSRRRTRGSTTRRRIRRRGEEFVFDGGGNIDSIVLSAMEEELDNGRIAPDKDRRVT